MDPFEIRLQFTRMLQRLNASVNAAKNCAAFALKHRELDDDLHSCILEQLERSSMNNRVNLLYFIDHLLEQSKQASYEGYVAKIQENLPDIIDHVVPEDGSGAQNVGSAKKVLLKLKERNIMEQNVYDSLLNVLVSRDHLHQGSNDVVSGGSGGAVDSQNTVQPLEAPRSGSTPAISTGSDGRSAGYTGTTTTIMTTQPDPHSAQSGGSASSLEPSPVALIPSAPATSQQPPSADTRPSVGSPLKQAAAAISPVASLADTAAPMATATINEPPASQPPAQPSIFGGSVQSIRELPAPPAPPRPSTAQPSTKGIRRRAIEERMEEDRERHKRLRETIWSILPNNAVVNGTPASGDAEGEQPNGGDLNGTGVLPYEFPGSYEFGQLWNDPENEDIDSDDMERMQEDMKIKKESISGWCS